MSIDKITVIKGLVFGAALGALCIVLLICIASAVFLGTGMLPGDMISYIIVAFCAVGAFTGGYLSTRLIKQNGIVWGLCTGALLLVFCIIGGIVMNGADATHLILYKAAAFVLFGAIGGVKGVNRKEKIKI